MIPYVIERVVKWGECDPAGIIYTPRALDYATEALEGWFRDYVGTDWLTLNRSSNMGWPTVHASLDFLRPMAVNQTIRVVLALEKIGETALTFRIDCLGTTGEAYVKVTMVNCIADFTLGRGVPIPLPVRERALSYQQACRERQTVAMSSEK